ncbi:Low-density lipoprotein receptor-related protein 4 [Thelohanellus kitauei]|uniref:Low-density lipoprotein receptor-related protein 4 n=1 Tax=Thelohanellus kitauei TaxID=669202 RepID=A0A0C2I5D2_THEKT|nr:Low-density lipoprotein receptor-related protein 4 [Thelohanellus kitauei]
MLVHTDLNGSRRLNRVSYNNFSKSIALNIQTKFFQKTRHPYQNTTCQFICDPLIKAENFCYCIDSVDTDRGYVCNDDDSACLNQFCVVFKCKNGHCPFNNVRCNSVDDCGDGSDEENCKKKCSINQHLCKKKCMPISTICDDVTYEYPTKNITGVFLHSNQVGELGDVSRH